MFNLHYGNDLKGLASALGARLAVPSAAGLLTPDIVLIPQRGLQRWLEITLAEQLGIVANLEFRLPAAFVWQVLAGERGDGLFDRDVLRWRLLPLLAELADEPVGAPIAAYLHSGSSQAGSSRAGLNHADLNQGDGSQLKRFQLAREFAAALERYQGYRRELLGEWERGRDADDWQAEAWRRLTRDAPPHRGRLLGEFIERYEHGARKPPNIPARLSVFGCLNISPDVLHFLGVLGRHCEVDFYLPTPCREYWGDVRSVREKLRAGAAIEGEIEQPLLGSFGRVGREFFELVFSYEKVQPSVEADVMREPARAALLGRIQGDILDLTTPDRAQALVVGDDDRSLQIHVCHSPLREVQVLHDRLLAMFERDPTLKPRDIAVMMPNVASYAPVIEAVFGALPNGDPRRIPYSVADRAAQDEHPIVAVFLQLTSLPTSRWTAREILELLGVPAIMRKLGLDARALDNLRGWLDAAGIRWGLDESTRAAFGAGSYRAFSWAEGIERLLLGYATGDDASVAGIVPVSALEGGAAAAFGQALIALRELERLAGAQAKPRTASEWQRLYQGTLAALLPDDSDDRDERRAIAAIHAALAALADNAQTAGCDEPLDWMTVRAFLAERLSETTSAQRFLVGGVSFCGMVPLRAIPFRVIAVLGLDDAAFPRREPANSIDRLQDDLRDKARRKLGDRSVRDDDRYLFLQLLTSAQDVFYLSYVGREARDGSEREPSALIAELLAVLGRDYFADEAAARAALVTEHTLQPFARALFDGSQPRLFTYHDEWRAAAGARRDGGLPQPFSSGTIAFVQEAPQRIRLDDLVAFWTNPARAFLHDVLGIELRKAEAKIAEDDPLAFDGLQKYQLKSALVDAMRADGRAATARADSEQRMRHGLPIGRAGDDIWSEQSASAAQIAGRIAAWRADKSPFESPPFEITLADDRLDAGVVIECALDDAYREGLLRWRVGKLSGKYWLRLWIEYLALASIDDPSALGFSAKPNCTLIAFDKRADQFEIGGLSVVAARQELAGLVAGYRIGQTLPLPFFPKSAWAYVRTLAGKQGKDTSEEKALRAARAEYDDNHHHEGENADLWFALAFRDRAPFDDSQLRDAFHDSAVRVFGTLAEIVRETTSP